MIKSEQILKNALYLQLVIDKIQQFLTYLCFGFKFEYLPKVVSSNIRKYLGISFLLWVFFFALHHFPTSEIKMKKKLKK